MLVEVVSGGVVTFDIVVVEEEVPLLVSLHGWPTPHIKWLQVSSRDAALIRGPPFMNADFTGNLGVFVSAVAPSHSFLGKGLFGVPRFLQVIGILCQATAILV